jgi:hypothetical protein
VGFAFGSLPRLNHLNLSIYKDPNPANSRHPVFPDTRSNYSGFSFIDPSDSFRDLENLVVRFTEPEKWDVPMEGFPLGNVKWLLLADMLHSWDISWTCRLLVAAPYLETLHVHFADHHRRVGMAVNPAMIRAVPLELYLLIFIDTAYKNHGSNGEFLRNNFLSIKNNFLSNHIYSLFILYQSHPFMCWFSCRHGF